MGLLEVNSAGMYGPIKKIAPTTVITPVMDPTMSLRLSGCLYVNLVLSTLLRCSATSGAANPRSLKSNETWSLPVRLDAGNVYNTGACCSWNCANTDWARLKLDLDKHVFALDRAVAVPLLRKLLKLRLEHLAGWTLDVARRSGEQRSDGVVAWEGGDGGEFVRVDVDEALGGGLDAFEEVAWSLD